METNFFSISFINTIENNNVDKEKNNGNLDHSEEKTCTVCLDPCSISPIDMKKTSTFTGFEFSKEDNRTVKIKCGHHFHANCLHDWVQTYKEKEKKPECPLCRQVFIDETYHNQPESGLNKIFNGIFNILTFHAEIYESYKDNHMSFEVFQSEF